MTEEIDKIKELATKAHGDQKRKYSGDPYVTHTFRVADTGREIWWGYRSDYGRNPSRCSWKTHLMSENELWMELLDHSGTPIWLMM